MFGVLTARIAYRFYFIHKKGLILFKIHSHTQIHIYFLVQNVINCYLYCVFSDAFEKCSALYCSQKKLIFVFLEYELKLSSYLIRVHFTSIIHPFLSIEYSSKGKQKNPFTNLIFGLHFQHQTRQNMCEKRFSIQ